ncbi:MAG: ATP-dependent helicase, partial [Ruminiclostridium sp.]|nr:ATP-dependent helicase [Ruminiclostridium sp.]
ISGRSRQHLGNEAAETRVDYISDHLGIDKSEVIQIINLLREERILADAIDLTAFIRRKEHKNRILDILRTYMHIENFLLTVVEKEEKTFHIKELNEQAESCGCTDVTPNRLKTVLNFWAIKNLIKKQQAYNSVNHIVILGLYERNILKEKLEKRHELAQFILEYIYDKCNMNVKEDESNNEEVLAEFSILELKEEFESRLTFFNIKASSEDIEDAIFYLSRIDALKIEGGFLVVYNGLTIERLEQDNRRKYKAEDYQKLNQFYENKIQQIHIVGEYARKMITDYKAALQFIDDYFRLNYSSFLNKYFKGSRQNEIKRNITPAKFRQLFGELSPTQLKIINDKESKYIVVAAGPGSGKTRVLVHKLASLLLMEDIKYEQLLMLTFSRSAATEFKKRLLKLIEGAANFVEIKTFHSYCFDLLGRVGTLQKSADIIKEAVRRIKNGEVETGRITKTVLVIDEAQDMDEDEFSLINALMDQNEEMRVIAVGDDDQNIFEFRGSSAKYLLQMIREKNAVMYEMVENYRSKRNLVDFSNQFVRRLSKRLKITRIHAVQNDTGRINLIRYRSSNLVIPLVNDLLTQELSGTTSVLCKTNEEALHITGLLLKNGLQAKLIQTNEGFSLYNLVEVRYFLEQLQLSGEGYTIDDDTWDKAKRNLSQMFAGSTSLELCSNIIRDFEAVNPKNRYKTDLEIFIRESQLEDFYGENIETIFVSTIHKTKGREFDNVFLMLDQYYTDTDEAIRLLYVALTRAKRNLAIHYNGSYLDS